MIQWKSFKQKENDTLESRHTQKSKSTKKVTTQINVKTLLILLQDNQCLKQKY